MDTVRCRECGTTFPGDRVVARRAGWEPFSHGSQGAIESGPMVCRECLAGILDELLAVMRRARGRR